VSGSHHIRLSRREREIVDILYRLGEASVADVLGAMADPPSYSAVRAMLRLLEEKGHVRHRTVGRRYVYAARVPRARASREAMRHFVKTFFDGSVERCVASILDSEAQRLSEEELERLSALIDEARRKEAGR
jgi:predicted transcriptional regulator